MNIFNTKIENIPDQKPVKTAQSVEEVKELRTPGINEFDKSRSVQHAERPRYGHKM